MNTTVLVALITGLSAIVPNIIITILNNRQQFKLQKFEIDEVAKRNAIIEFANSVSDCISDNGSLSINNSIRYDKALNKLLFYFPNLNIETIQRLTDSLFDIDINSKQDVLRPLIKELSKELFEK